MKIKKLGANVAEHTFKDGTRILVSYETPVAAFLAIGHENTHILFGFYLKSKQFHSRTTSHHVKEWLNGATAREVPQDEIAALMEAR